MLGRKDSLIDNYTRECNQCWNIEIGHSKSMGEIEVSILGTVDITLEVNNRSYVVNFFSV